MRKVILSLHINCTETVSLDTGKGSINLVLFDGSCSGDYFNGQILPGGADTQKFLDNQEGTLSARYMLSGCDYKNNACRIFIENNAVLNGDKIITKPVIYTDSTNLKWLETADLYGVLSDENGKLIIDICGDSDV